jgi:RNA polymerase sigma-70 factor, ECF subfamily
MTFTLPLTRAVREEEIQEFLFRQYGGMLYRLALRYLRDVMQAEDVASGAFVRIFKGMAACNFDNTPQLEAWMRRIVINEALSVLRRRKRSPFVDMTEAKNVIIEPDCLSLIGVSEIERHIEALPEGCRTVFNLYVVDGYKHGEIAEMLRISEGTSKSQLHKARMMIQQKINESRS